MNEEKFEQNTNTYWQEHGKRRSEGRILAGALLLLIGGLWLMREMNILVFPSWFFTWPLFFVVFGLFTGIRHRFRGGFWILITLFGALMLWNKMDPSLQLNRYVAPFVIIGLGMLFILKPRPHRWRHRREWRDGRREWKDQPNELSVEPDTVDQRDFLDVTAVFGGVKKNVLSKSFRGGDIVSFMGGSEIDLTQADFEGRIKIDTTNIFGGTKLIVPPTWDVQSEMVAIFGGVDDKRPVAGVKPDPGKLLILDGTCLFGGIEIRSYG